MQFDVFFSVCQTRVDGHILRDIGISEAQRFIEVNKLS